MSRDAVRDSKTIEFVVMLAKKRLKRFYEGQGLEGL